MWVPQLSPAKSINMSWLQLGSHGWGDVSPKLGRVKPLSWKQLGIQKAPEESRGLGGGWFCLVFTKISALGLT